jgi:hypothetical protein
MLGVRVSKLNEAGCVFNCKLPLRSEQNRDDPDRVSQTYRASTRFSYRPYPPRSKVLHENVCVATRRFPLS